MAHPFDPYAPYEPEPGAVDSAPWPPPAWLQQPEPLPPPVDVTPVEQELVPAEGWPPPQWQEQPNLGNVELQMPMPPMEAELPVDQWSQPTLTPDLPWDQHPVDTAEPAPPAAPQALPAPAYGAEAQTGKAEPPLDPAAAEVYRQSRMTDEQRVKDNARREYEREQLGLREKDQALTDDRIAQRENTRKLDQVFADVQRERDSIIADAKAIANTPIDRNRWINSRTTMQKVAGLGSAFVQGWLNEPGKPNAAIEMMMRAADKDVDDQMADIKNRQWGVETRRSVVADMIASGKDIHTIKETARLSILNNLEKQIEVDMGKYDPNGTLAARQQQQLALLRANKLKATQDAEDRLFKQRIERGELGVKQGGLNLDREKFDYEKKKDAEKGPAPAGLTAEQERLLDRQDKNAAFTVPGATNADGSVYTAASTTAAEDLRDQDAVAREVIDLARDIREARKAHGSESGWVNSEGYQKLKSRGASLQAMVSKNLKLGTWDSGSQELTSAIVGFDDPTRWKDIDAGLASLEETTVRKMNHMLVSSSRDKRFKGGWEVPTRSEQAAFAKSESADDVIRMKSSDQLGVRIDAAARSVGHLAVNPTLIATPELGEAFSETEKLVTASGSDAEKARFAQVKASFTKAVAKAKQSQGQSFPSTRPDGANAPTGKGQAIKLSDGSVVELE